MSLGKSNSSRSADGEVMKETDLILCSDLSTSHLFPVGE